MASFPSAAAQLAERQQQQPSLLQQYAQLQQIRNSQSQQQTAQLNQTALSQENQQRGLALQDQQTLRSLAPNHVTKDDKGNVTGFDTEGYFNEALGKQVNPSTVNQMRMQYATTTKDLASAAETVRTNEQAKNKALYEALESARTIKDPQQRQAALIQALPSLSKQGVDISKIKTDQPITDDMINFDEAGIGMHAQMLADAKTTAETNKTTAEGQLAQQKADFAKKYGFTSAEEADARYRSIVQNQKLNKPVSADDTAYKAAYEKQKEIVPQFNLNIAAATGAGKPAADVAKQFGMSPEAFDQAAEKYYQTGAMPQMGRGPAGMALQRAVMNRTAELHTGASLAEGSAEYAANKASLVKLQSNLDAVSAFEKTANKNLDLFTSLAQKAVNTGIPLLNAPLRTGAKLLAGSEDQLALDAARQVAVNEIAKVTSSPGLTGQLSDTARKEIAEFIPESATYGQALRVAQVLKQDMANRHQSYQEQIGDIQKRIGGQGGGGSAKILTSAQIAQAAKDHNVSVEEATKQAKASGYEVKP